MSAACRSVDVCLLVVGWFIVVVCWLLIGGCGSMVVGCCLLVVGCLMMLCHSVCCDLWWPVVVRSLLLCVSVCGCVFPASLCDVCCVVC